MSDTRKNIRLGWIGTGVMGLAMCSHLMDAGYPLTVFNRTAAKLRPLVERGAKPAASAKEVGAASDIVFSMVAYPADVEAVSIGPDGALAGMRPGSVLCDMSTSSPTLAARIAEQAAQKDVIGMDAPVTGGDVGAKEATLAIFVGGARPGFERLLPCLEAMGRKIMYCGAAGMGQQAKLANQVAIAGVMFSVCESLLYAQQAGLDVRRWHELVSVGAAGSVAMKTLGSRMMDGDFAPGFFIDHFIKDLGLVLEECRRMHLILPSAELADTMYRSMQAHGQGRNGTQAFISALAELSAKAWAPVPK